MVPEGSPYPETPQVCLDLPWELGFCELPPEPHCTLQGIGGVQSSVDMEVWTTWPPEPLNWGRGTVPVGWRKARQYPGRRGLWHADCVARGRSGGVSGAPSMSASFPDLRHRSGWRVLSSL